MITEIISGEGHLNAVLRDGVLVRVFSGIVAVILYRTLINYHIYICVILGGDQEECLFT